VIIVNNFIIGDPYWGSFCYAPPQGCPNLFPTPSPPPTPTNPIVLKAETYQYNAISDGIKRIYTNADELSEYGNRGILDPSTVSYTNLFVNGALQPPNLYLVQEGLLIFTSIDPPSAGVPINLQFISILLNLPT
jgi:hypothetical protein